MIRSCQSEGPFYKIMNGFIIKINSLEILKLACHV